MKRKPKEIVFALFVLLSWALSWTPNCISDGNDPTASETFDILSLCVSHFLSLFHCLSVSLSLSYHSHHRLFVWVFAIKIEWKTFEKSSETNWELVLSWCWIQSHIIVSLLMNTDPNSLAQTLTLYGLSDKYIAIRRAKLFHNNLLPHLKLKFHIT